VKKLIVVLVLLGSGLFLSCVSFAAVSEEDAYLAAMDMYNKKDFEKAGPLLSDFYAKYRRSKYTPNVMLKLAELETDFFKAEAIYKDVIREKPDTEFEAEAVFSLSRLYFAGKEYIKSCEYAGIIMGKFSNTVWIEPAYYYTMLSLNAQKKYSETEGFYNRYLSNANYFMFKNRVKLAYAESLYSRAKFTEAIPFFSQVISEINREKYIYAPDVYSKIINCYKNTGNSSEKEKYVYNLKEKYPDSPEAKLGGFLLPAAVEETIPEDNIKPDTSAAVSKSGVFYTVQIGAYTNKKFADYDADKLKKKKYLVFTKQEGKYTKVMVGKTATKEEADELALKLAKQENIKNYLVKQAWE
jgi:TolA-binding protein